MAKFSLLTSLTLQAAGFNKGIDQAKKGAKALADGVNTAGNTMVKALSPLTSQLGGLGGQFTGLATGIISAFRKIIPAINSVKAAFMATGIGAIIVVISTAIAGLVGWMKRTDEGADGMRKAFDIVKAVINTVLTKISLLGSAIVKLFKGDFKGAAEDAKNAVTGWGQAIKDGVKSANLLNDAQDKLEAFEVDYELKREKINARIAELEYEAKLAQEDNTMSAQQKLNVVNKLNAAIEEGYQLDRQQKLLALEVAKQTKAISADNEDTRKAVNLAEKELIALDTAHSVALKSALKQTKALREESEKQVLAVKTGIEALSTLKPIEISIKPKIDTKGFKLEGIQGPPPDFLLPDTDLAADLWNDYKDGAINAFNLIQGQGIIAFQGIAKEAVNLGSILTGGLLSGIGALTDAFGNLFSGTEAGFKDVVTVALQTIQQIVNALLAEAIAAMIAKESHKGIIGLATAAIGIGILTALWKSKVPKFHSGGIVGGGGEVPAILKPREMVLTGGQQKNLFDLINKGGNTPGTVLIKFQNGSLEGYLDYNQRTANSYR